MAGTGPSSAGSSVLPSGGSNDSSMGGSTSANGGATASAGTGVTMGGSVAAGGVMSTGGDAGSTSVAGTSAGGMSTGGSGTGGGLTKGPTAGCGKPNNDMLGKDVLHNLTVNGVARRYWTKLPTAYDGTTPMPLVFWGPGCGASGVEGSPLDNSIKDSAIRVFVIGTGGCFDTGGPEPETGYFNAVLDDVQANYCTDKGRVFVSGYSSGAWLSYLLACTAGDRITAIGTAAGGFHANNPMCKGNPGGILHAGLNDTANPITKLNKDGVNEGSSAGRDALLKANGCSMDTKPWDAAYAICQEYQGCKTPVIWCPQPGVGHSNGEEVSRTGFWKFWSTL